MTHTVAILIFPGFELLDATGPASVFAAANHVLGETGDPPFYRVDLISPAGGLTASSSGIALQSEKLSEYRADTVDTFLVSGGEAEYLRPAMSDPDIRRWAPCCAQAASRFGSVCSGAFVLGSLGLLDGRRVATHWSACGELARLYPRVTVDAESLFVTDEKVWTSAGVTTGIDMALAMVGQDIHAGVAGQVAKRLVLYAQRPGYQSQFSRILTAQVNADSPFADLIDWMQANLRHPLDVVSLAARTGLSERSFYRKFLATTGETPARFVEALRLDAARMLLSQGLSLKAIAAQVGLSPANRLAAAFERRFGVSPRVFRAMHTGG